MIARASGVTIRENEAALLPLERIGVPNCLEKERHKTVLETLWAVAIVDQRGVTDVRAVVRGVEVLAVPARRKHELHTDSVSAVLVHVVLAGQEVAIQRRLRLLLVVHTVKTNGLLHQPKLRGFPSSPQRFGRVRPRKGKVPKGWITSNHAEAFGKGSNIFSIEQIVAVQSVSVNTIPWADTHTQAFLQPGRPEHWIHSGT